MSTITKRISGLILVTVPTIIYGGFFLLSVLAGEQTELGLNDFQKSMFRAGHAHAGVLVILSLVAQLLADGFNYSKLWDYATRISFPLAAILVSGGFFASAIGSGLTAPNGLIVILYVGALSLVFGTVALGIGLLRAK